MKFSLKSRIDYITAYLRGYIDETERSRPKNDPYFNGKIDGMKLAFEMLEQQLSEHRNSK